MLKVLAIRNINVSYLTNLCYSNLYHILISTEAKSCQQYKYFDENILMKLKTNNGYYD